MLDPQSRIDQFWKWLLACQEQLDEVTQADQPFFDVILQRLKQVDDRLGFEVSGPNPKGPREFVVTANGQADAFPTVEALAAAAPSIPGWRVVPLKPPMGFEFAINFDDVHLDPRAMWFQPREIDATPEKLHLRIAIPDYRPEIDRLAISALYVILDTALGERTTALDIGQVEACAPPNDPDAAYFFPLPRLPEFIEWHRANRPPLP